MDTSDPDIRFDGEGVCNYVAEYQAHLRSLPRPEEAERRLKRLLASIKSHGGHGDHDCVVGLSGGVDSSFLLVKAVEWGLRPLAVHFDNGWNTELAVNNVESVVGSLGVELETVVVDWDSFKRLQRSYFEAGVLDLEIPTDHLIFAAISKVARKRRIRAVLSGHNDQTEWLLPRSWWYSKFDAVNIRDIFRKHGEGRMVDLPLLDYWQRLRDQKWHGIEQLQPMQLVPYQRSAAKSRLAAEFGWRDYGGKHHESVFTRFYQGHILPNRFGIDKRRAHLSNAILNGEITREASKAELNSPPYPLEMQAQDKVYVAKKLGFSAEEFDHVLRQPVRAHSSFRTHDASNERWMALASRFTAMRNLVGWKKGVSPFKVGERHG